MLPTPRQNNLIWLCFNRLNDMDEGWQFVNIAQILSK